MDLQAIQGFVFDLDGTLYLGERLLPGAQELLAFLRQHGRQTLFVTNKPLYPREEYAAKLTRLGIPAAPEEVITSGFVLARHLAEVEPHLALYVLGEENLKSELRAQGLCVLEELDDQDEKDVIQPTGIDAVVVAFDRTLTYRKLNTAYQALLRGARFFATNPDKTCPMPGGGIPDAGATLAALKSLTGREVDVLAGKPSRLMMRIALEQMGLGPQQCMLLGDRLETDIRMAKDAGMWAACVLTGTSSRAQATAADPRPDLILENAGELLFYFAG